MYAGGAHTLAGGAFEVRMIDRVDAATRSLITDAAKSFRSAQAGHLARQQKLEELTQLSLEKDREILAQHEGILDKEREIAALFDAVLAANGAGTSYHSIVTVRGEILHNPDYVNPLSDGDLLLLACI